MSAAPPLLSLVVPAWQEARRLPPTLREIGRFARAFQGGVEVLIVVERSPDGTLEIARELAAPQADSTARFHVIDSGPRRGKGHAVRTGMLRATGRYIFYMDADLSVPLAEIPAFLTALAGPERPDLLIGNRQHARSRITRAQAWPRRTMGQTFNAILALLGLTGRHDTQCGFKAFRREAAQRIFTQQTIDGFAFDVEVLLLAENLGLKVHDLPVEWINSPESKVRILRDSLQMLRDTARLKRLLRPR